MEQQALPGEELAHRHPPHPLRHRLHVRSHSSMVHSQVKCRGKHHSCHTTENLMRTVAYGLQASSLVAL